MLTCSSLYMVAFIFKIALPSLYQTLCFEDVALWRTYYHHSMCEQEFPSILGKKVSLFQQVSYLNA